MIFYFYQLLILTFIYSAHDLGNYADIMCIITYSIKAAIFFLKRNKTNLHVFVLALYVILIHLAEIILICWTRQINKIIDR